MEKKTMEENINKKDINIDEKNQPKKHIIAIVITLIIILLLAIFSVIFSLLNINNKNIVSGVKIEGVEVSGLSQEEAKNKMKLIYDEKTKKEIILKNNEYETNVSPEIFETNYDVEKAVEDAILVGRSSNIVANNYQILLALMGKKDIDVDVSINEEVAKQKIDDIQAELPGAVEESNYFVEENELIIKSGKEGLKIDSENLISKIFDNLKNIDVKNEYINLPVYNKKPDGIDIEKIHEEVYKEVKDAYYTKDPFTIYPEVEGVDFDVEEAKKILEQEQDEYVIKLKITKPKVTISQIGSEAFPDLLATFSTKYDGGDVNRTTNLRLAVSKINEKVILPGETFSYNKTVGERTASAGYRNAKIYSNGQVVDGIGGGICQISSTLYNAVLMSNLEVVERRNHQFVTSYLPAGRDATVVYGLTDFKFKNSRSYAVKIKASVANGIATVSIYGIKEANEYSFTFSSKVVSTIPFSVQYVDDPTLDVGVEKVKQNGTNGKIVETYITKNLNGAVVSTRLLSRDTYNAMQRIILKGTKGVGNTEGQVPEISFDVNATQSNSQIESNSNIENNGGSTEMVVPQSVSGEIPTETPAVAPVVENIDISGGITDSENLE